ncbi:MAG: aminoacyl-tRNA hydrolase [candidate division WOR-3 bacterium]
MKKQPVHKRRRKANRLRKRRKKKKKNIKMTIFGLGNPTAVYANTRHNLGFMVLDLIAQRLRTRFHHLPGKFIARTQFAGTKLTLIKPLLYMNESGVVVREHLAEEPDDFLVVVDDIALPFGRLRLRPHGSDGGHKGLASIIYHLGSNKFPRLRIGICPPTPIKGSITEYVLSPFTKEESKLLPQILERAADACLFVISEGLDQAMNRFNSTVIRHGTRGTVTDYGLPHYENWYCRSA